MSQISLVGAGPGPLELLTLRALQRLEAAEVVIYDRLVGSEILARIPKGAARFDVGKRCGEPSPSQDQINALKARVAGPSGDEFNFTIQGDYRSEGRNALEPHCVLVSKTIDPAAAVQLIKRYASGADAAVAQTYAAKLLHDWPPIAA